ncbi:MAG: hypothetical protein L3J39_07425 [Verrucomicrobiales bacterium]|nr:hypothetical protein [Verrucomicrobiales bacterium]
MDFLKPIFSVYIGVYLILPGCLCQMLAPFGIQVLHAPPDGSIDPNHSAPVAILTAPIPCDNPVDCHCDDSTLKTAEQSVVADVLYQEDIFKAVAACPWAAASDLPKPSPHTANQMGSRAPPPHLLTTSLKRPLQTLYGLMLI